MKLDDLLTLPNGILKEKLRSWKENVEEENGMWEKMKFEVIENVVR